MSFVIGVTKNGKSWIASDGKSFNSKTGEVKNDNKKIIKISNILIGYTGPKELCEDFINILTSDDWVSARTVFNALSNVVKQFNAGKSSTTVYIACFLIIGEDNGTIKHFLISSLTNQFIIEDCTAQIQKNYLYSNHKFVDKYNSSVKRAFDKKFKSDYYRMNSLLTHIFKFDDSVNKVPYIELSNPR